MLGIPSKNSQSYFRSWNLCGIASNLCYGFGPVGGTGFELQGSALSIMADSSTTGTKIVVNEEGLYYAQVSLRINAGTTEVSIARVSPSTVPGFVSGTSNEVALVNVSATTTRFNASGFAYMLPGQYFMVLSTSNSAVSGSSLQIMKVSGAL